MKNSLEKNGFQTLAENEALAITGGRRWGNASGWVQLGNNITSAALSETANYLNGYRQPYSAYWVNQANSINNRVLTDVMNGLRYYGL